MPLYVSDREILRQLLTVGDDVSLVEGHAGSIDGSTVSVLSEMRQRFAGDPMRRVALGWHEGGSVAIRYGINSDVDASGGGPEDLWCVGGLYTGFPTGVAETVQVVSSSADDASNGTGMRTMRVDGLDADYVPQTEDFVMSGVTPVVGTKLWSRVSRAYGLTAGSGGTNAGIVQVKHSTTTANVFAQIPVGYGSSYAGAWTVPAGCTDIVPVINIGVSNNVSTAQEALITLAHRRYGTSMWRYGAVAVASTASPIDRQYVSGHVFPEKTDVVARVLSATADNLRISMVAEVFTFTNDV